jgi:hypothetical protein
MKAGVEEYQTLQRTDGGSFGTDYKFILTYSFRKVKIKGDNKRQNG